MMEEMRLKNLQVPAGPIDVVLDTDAYNEIDDQFAIAYLLNYGEKCTVKGLTAAPFFNSNSTSPADGMERSYQELLKLLKLAGREELEAVMYRGSEEYLPDEKTPVDSPAARFMAELANSYSPEKPLYIVAIGAITNVASAMLMNPSMKENCVVVWLGGHGHHMPHTREFNMYQDVAAARVVFDSRVPLVQLPCGGVVDHFYTTRYELEHWLLGKNPLATYLVENTFAAMGKHNAEHLWSRVIWDVTAVAWLVNDENRFMSAQLVHTPIPEYDNRYAFDSTRHLMTYVYRINRDKLMEDLFKRLA